ncbi:calcium/proton exchanger [Tilletiaria anomala UBC 951]|uniref:Vacuolar calcium ion transporter n=1 Tax=Tilletiaria anomala (strain ATCC 24038 / CBS 436.72 / UBC 951) TaxID=1037660 RepID=A0A066VPK8_TILAU|nr:calcium/proton exchanger [Tilletiaria anomala UBC 951]KDN43687.1 calcium/proton exchanger [Tilletiaria anomala UBC 951]
MTSHNSNGLGERQPLLINHSDLPAPVDFSGRPSNAADANYSVHVDAERGDEGLPLHRPTSYPARAQHYLSGPSNEPNFATSFRWFLTSSWLNVLLVFVPLGIVAEHLGWSAAAIFSLNFIAIVPLAKLLGDATEQASLKLGQTLGGLMNATFGNAVELIVGIVALTQGQLRIVQTSLIGSILSNILLVLGMAFVAGGICRKESTFQQTAAQASGSILMLGGITVVIPAAYQGSVRSAEFFTTGSLTPDKQTEAGLLFISRGTSIILLLVYTLYLFFQLKTHAFLFEAQEEEEEEEEEEAKMTPVAAMLGLLIVTIVTSFNADYLVGAIDEVASEYHIPKSFIGTILLPIVGNAAEHVTSVWMAAKNKMEIALGVAVGSSIQIAIGVIPALVIVGWIIDQPLTLYFQSFETVILVASVVLANCLIQDGKSNYIEGFMLCALYLVAALAFWVN